MGSQVLVVATGPDEARCHPLHASTLPLLLVQGGAHANFWIGLGLLVSLGGRRGVVVTFWAAKPFEFHKRQFMDRGSMLSFAATFGPQNL